MKDRNFANPFQETPPQGRGEGTFGLKAMRWEDFVWLLIVSGLATLWIVLLMSPSWR